MKTKLKPIFYGIATWLWICLSEFFRNSLLLRKYWVEHYRSLGLIFPEAPLNGLVWSLWALSLTGFIYILSQKFSFWKTVGISWFTGFFMMWLSLGNLQVLPFTILYMAIPLSFLEIFLGSWIIFGIYK